MVAGLNHAMHKISAAIEYKEKLTQFLKDNSIDPSAKPSQDILNKYKIIFKEYWDSGAQWAEFADEKTIATWESEDNVKISLDKNGKIFTTGDSKPDWGVTNSKGKVILAPGLLNRNNYKLATTFIHEMRHSIDYVSGFYNMVWQLPNVEHIMEYRAYMEEFKWTNSMPSTGLHQRTNGLRSIILINKIK